MAPATTQAEGEEGSVSRSRARGWRRKRSRNPLTSPALNPPGADQLEPSASSERRSSSPNPPRAVQLEPCASSQSRRVEPGAAKKQSKKRKRKGKRIRAADLDEEAVPQRSKTRSMDDKEASCIAVTEQASSSDASSAVSSPLRTPYIPRAVKGVDRWGRDVLEPFIKINPAILDTFAKHKAKYSAKHRNQLSLVTLNDNVPHSRLTDSRFESVHESVAEVVLKVAKVVFGLSSYIDSKLLNQTSGLLIEWDKDSRIGTILTSAFLIRSKSKSFDEWLGTDEYVPHAEVHVHLLDKDDTVLNARLMHYHRHYNFAVFKIRIDAVAEIPSFSEAKFGQEVLVLGRDKNMYLSVDYGSVLRKGPSSFERNHYMFASCEVNQCAPGGPVIDVSGQFLGMVNLPDMAFTPSAIIKKCLKMLKKFNCVARLHLGMKLSAIKLLDPIHREKIIRKCVIDTGLIVTEVSEGSVAEKNGIRRGDVILRWNGKSVSTTIELESILLHMSKERLTNGGCIGSTVDVFVDIFYVRKNCCRTIMLSLEVCEDAEVFTKGEYAITAAHCTTASGTNGDTGSGEDAPCGD